jgi:hypothetical protein
MKSKDYVVFPYIFVAETAGRFAVSCSLGLGMFGNKALLRSKDLTEKSKPGGGG